MNNEQPGSKQVFVMSLRSMRGSVPGDDDHDSEHNPEKFDRTNKMIQLY